MKILYVITGLGMGGAETITIDVAQKMLERGHEVAVLYLTGDSILPCVKPKERIVSISL